MLALLAVTLAVMATASSTAAAVTTDQRIEVWKHVCLATGGDVSIGAGSSYGIVGCGHQVPLAWNRATITKFRKVCLTALGGTFFSFDSGLSSEGVICLLL